MFNVSFTLDHCYTVPVLYQKIEVLKLQIFGIHVRT
jgi:hypothetical protein